MSEGFYFAVVLFRRQLSYLSTPQSLYRCNLYFIRLSHVPVSHHPHIPHSHPLLTPAFMECFMYTPNYEEHATAFRKWVKTHAQGNIIHLWAEVYQILWIYIGDPLSRYNSVFPLYP